ncbi:MAG TPA: thioredoxin family protein [Saprospiraceae bacterium]|nr:thioredoxin family protein [Saprospiraceae bacterium]HHH53033.1 thioredoxin family protein [Bacteroidota bacterium]
MKNYLLLILTVAFTAFISCSQNKSSNEHGWINNYEKGLEIAKQENKHVFLFFTGSDWCPPCKKLHHDVLETPEFEQFAKDNLVLVLMDFPRKPENKLSAEQTKYNKSMSRKFAVRGFPTAVILDKDGKEINRWVGYRPTDLQSTLDKYRDAIK